MAGPLTTSIPTFGLRQSHTKWRPKQSVNTSALDRWWGRGGWRWVRQQRDTKRRKSYGYWVIQARIYFFLDQELKDGSLMGRQTIVSWLMASNYLASRTTCYNVFFLSAYLSIFVFWIIALDISAEFRWHCVHAHASFFLKTQRSSFVEGLERSVSTFLTVSKTWK